MINRFKTESKQQLGNGLLLTHTLRGVVQGLSTPLVGGRGVILHNLACTQLKQNKHRLHSHMTLVTPIDLLLFAKTVPTYICNLSLLIGVIQLHPN